MNKEILFSLFLYIRVDNEILSDNKKIEKYLFFFLY